MDVMHEKSYVGNRFDKVEVASAATLRRGSLLYKTRGFLLLAVVATPFLVYSGHRCCVLHPDAATMKARIADYQAIRQSSFIKAAMVKESQLNVVDILVGYDLSAKAWVAANGKGSPEAFAAKVVDEMNACLKNTDLDRYFRFRLAGVVVVNLDVSSQSLYQMLASDLVTPDGTIPHKSGEWAKVAAQRETVGADVVTFWVDSPASDNVGFSYCLQEVEGFEVGSNPELMSLFGDWAYSICRIGSVLDEFKALHGIGHNMGCGHADATQVNVEVTHPGPQLYEYSSGYCFSVGAHSYDTIMAYSCDGHDGGYNNIPFFSSSEHSYQGVPVGDAKHDNTRTLQETYSHVAQYRISKLPPDDSPVQPDINPDVPVVTDVVAKQRYPWNGLVDITCKVSGIEGTTKKQYFELAAVMPDSGKIRYACQFWIVQNGTKSTDFTVQTNGNYHLLWDAQADLGQVRYEDMVVRATLTVHQKVQLWAGGPYWADTNIGAENPEDYGYYFWWGDTVGYKRENNAWEASDGSSSNFAFGDGNTPTYNKSITTLQSEGWITADNVLAPEHDAAHVHWGGSWRMPTSQELDDLSSKCDWTWTTMSGVNGYVVRGRGDYASDSIFLPCSGRDYGASLDDAGSYGYYWSSVPDSYGYFAWHLCFDSGDHYTYDDFGSPDYAGSVRPVQGFTK